MNLNININKLLPLFLILLMLMVVLPQSFAMEGADNYQLASSNDDLKVIEQPLAEDLDSIDTIDDENSVLMNSVSDDYTSEELVSEGSVSGGSVSDKSVSEQLISEKIVEENSYDYVSTPNQNSIVYTKGENRNITIIIDADLDKLETMEGEPFYVWVNGEGENNKVAVYNIFADVEEFDYDLKLVSNKFVNGFNNLTFHPNTALLNSAGFSNHDFKILTLYYFDPDYNPGTNGSGDSNGSAESGGNSSAGNGSAESGGNSSAGNGSAESGGNSSGNGTGDASNSTNNSSYVSTPSEEYIYYVIGENKNITVNIDYDISKSSEFENNDFYVWINGESISNAVKLTNVDATVSVLNLDLISISNHLKEGLNNLSFHPSVDVLEQAGFSDYKLNQLKIIAAVPVRENTTLSIDRVGDDGTINIILADSQNNGISDADVKYSLDDDVIAILKTDSNGKASFKVDNSGLFDLTLSYIGNLTYNPSDYSIKLLSTQKIVNQEVYIDKNNTVYVNRTVEVPVYVDNNVTVYENRTVEVPVYVNETVEVPVYIDRNNTVYVNVTKNRTQSKIQSKNMVTTVVNQAVDGRCGKYFEVNLTDSNGNPLANKPIKIGFNGVVYNRTTNASGGAKLQINLGYKGDYTFAIGFLGDDDYTGAFEVSKIKVNLQSPKISSGDKTYKSSANKKTISATLKSSLGNPISGLVIKFTVNGKTYSAKTNSKGLASVNVSLNKKGTYNFTAKYAGNNQYSAVSVSKKLIIK